MRLFSISEGASSASAKVVDALKNFGIIKPFDSNHAISFKVAPDQLDRVKSLLRHYGWQLHSASTPSKGVIYADATPLKNQPYKAPPVLYHITDRANLPEIMEKGLNLKSQTPGMKFPKRLYLYPTEEMAAKRFEMARQLKRFANKVMPDPVVLRIDNRHGRYNTFIDPEYHMGMGGDDDQVNIPIYTTKTVRPTDISVGHGGS